MPSNTPSLVVVSPSQARAQFAALVRRAESGEDVGIGSRGIATVRLTRALGPDMVPVPTAQLYTLLGALAERHGSALAAASDTDTAPRMSECVSTVYWLLELPDLALATDYVMRLLWTTRSAGVQVTADSLVADMALAAPESFAHARHRLSELHETVVAQAADMISDPTEHAVLVGHTPPAPPRS